MDGRYRRTAAVGSDSDTWFGNVAGIHASPDGIYVFDAAEPAVVQFNFDLEFQRQFGRRGEGPGEFRTSHRLSSHDGGSFRRVDGDSSMIAVFDMWNVSLFDRNGHFERILVSPSPDIGLGLMLARISVVDDGLLYGSGGYDTYLRRMIGLKDPVYSVKYLRKGQVRDIVRLVLAPPTVGVNGIPFRGPNQARPVWDASSGCVVASDGESPWLIVSSLGAEKVDTIALPLPDRDPPPVDPDDLRSLLPGSRTINFPSPSATRRIDDLVIDPDGNVWVLPIQPEPAIAAGVEVIRISLATRRVTLDTLPRFPREFGEAGVYYATALDEMDRVIVERYELEGVGGNSMVTADDRAQ